MAKMVKTPGNALLTGFYYANLVFEIMRRFVIVSLILDHSKLTITGSPPVEWSLVGGESDMANKAELVSEVAAKTDLTKKEVAAAVDAIFSSIQEDLAKGEKVQLIGFGTFEVRHRAARKGRNPQTGAEIEIPASKVPAFKPGKALKDAVK